MTSPAAQVAVSCWGELVAEKRLPGVLRVLVDGQHAGAIWREDGTWHASHQANVRGKPRQTEHATALEDPPGRLEQLGEPTHAPIQPGAAAHPDRLRSAARPRLEVRRCVAPPADLRSLRCPVVSSFGRCG